MSLLLRLLAWTPSVGIVACAAVAWAYVKGGGMQGVTAWYLFLQGIPLLGILLLLGNAGYWTWKRRWSRPVVANLVVGLLALLPIGPQVGLFGMAFPASLDDTEPTATVRLPADEPILVGWGGDTPDVNRHVIAPDQRWAYDLLVEPALLGSETLEDYGCWGVTVVVPAAGTVTLAKDGLPDQTPGEMDPAHPRGNAVGIRLASGTYLLIAHLMQGSVAVQEGEAVAEGQPIGKCGNSGHTSEPHIHIHHQRQDPKKFPNGFAEGLPLYFRDHDGPPMPTGGLEVVDGKPVAKGVTVRHVEAR